MHWTYRKAPKRSDLEQGDILLPTEALRAVFRSVHPHFDDTKYLGYVVISQTCDLVRRGRQNVCDAQYISVAVIRPLHQVLFDLLDQVCVPIVPGAYRTSDRVKGKELLQRIFNQNEWKLGVFYLHPDADLATTSRRERLSGFGDNGVCLLRVSVALLRQHYNVLRAARCGRLRSEFANKLGWMVGNLYSRVATPDWADSVAGGSGLDALVDDFLGDSQVGSARPIWLADDQLAALVTAEVVLDTLTREDLTKKLAGITVETSLDRAVREVSVELGRVLADVPADRVEAICNRLRNNGKFRKAVKS